MNFRIVTHLLMTDLRRLRWLLLACGALVLLASWPALSFSAGDFDMPRSGHLLDGGEGNTSFVDALEKHGLISKQAVWSSITVRHVAGYLVLIVAGCLGFHSRQWSEGRPVRRRESLLAKAAGLLLFLILPLSLISATVGRLHGASWSTALAGSTALAAVNLPALLGVMLFAAYCGRWWTWLAGMSGMFLICTTLPIALQLSSGPDWFNSPLRMVAAHPFPPSLKLWIAAGVLGILLIWVRRDLPGTRKLGIALAAILAASQFVALFPRSPKYWYHGGDVFIGRPTEDLPDWSARLHPELDGKSLEASVDRGVLGRGAYGRSLFSFDDKSYMNLLLPWKTGGVPADSYVNWVPVGSSALKVGDTVVSSTPAIDHMGYGYHGDTDEAALAAVVKPEGGKLRWDSPSELSDARLLAEVLTPVDAGTVSEASLEMNLQGTVIQLEKIADVPFGKPVTVHADGMVIHIRRLDLENYMPVADICFVASGQQDRLNLGLPFNNWIGVIYFPKQSSARLPRLAQSSSMPLAAGLTAIRNMYLTGQTSDRKPDLRGYDEARFILVKRRRIATASAEIRTPTLPFVVRINSQSDPDARDSFDPPPFIGRPDPSTASPGDFEKWMTVSYSSFDKGWGSRNLADFVPRYLDRILRRPCNLHPPSSPEGQAIEAACPESRKREVIDAMIPASRSDTNWIPDLLIRRGWVDDAKPEILQMLANGQIGNNVFAQLMVANLEDPQTYPKLLEEKFWFETYQRLRRLPDVEPLLTDAIGESYRQALEELQYKSGSDDFHLHLAPAAHGMPEALARLLKVWDKLDVSNRPVKAEYMREVIRIPGNADDWRAVMGALAGRGATDFRYDPLARQWVPIAAP